MQFGRTLTILLLTAAAAGCKTYTTSYSAPPATTSDYTIYSSVGDSATVAATLAEFRAALGGSLNAPNSPPAGSGRREINWDGVSPALTNVDTFPAGFFNTTSKRGVVFSTPGTGFRIDSTAFASVDTNLPSQFKAFSPKKLFVAVGSNVVGADFKVVGTTATGLVKGFGAIFSDVDRNASTRIQFYDQNDIQLAVVNVPAQAGARTFSFLGVAFDSAVVARVVITSGEAALNSHNLDQTLGGIVDLVAMDDFIYGEPQPLH